MDIIKETFDFNTFLEKLKDRQSFNGEILELFGDLEMIELRVRDEKKIVYMLQVTKAEPLLDVKIDRCKHATAKFETVDALFKLDVPLGTVLKDIQTKAFEILEEMDDEYLDTY